MFVEVVMEGDAIQCTPPSQRYEQATAATAAATAATAAAAPASDPIYSITRMYKNLLSIPPLVLKALCTLHSFSSLLRIELSNSSSKQQQQPKLFNIKARTWRRSRQPDVQF